MKISFHTCKGKINKPHKPELNKRIKSFKDGLKLLRKHNKVAAYIDWDKIPGHHYILYSNGLLEDYINYSETAETKDRIINI